VKKTWLSLAAITILLFAITNMALANELSLRVPFVKKAPRIDGQLDDEAWRIAEQKGGKGTLQTHLNGKPATYKSDVFVCWDDDNLYIAYKNYQKKETVVATFFNDGDLSYTKDDDNGSFISTTFPAETWMQVITNPNGIRTTFGMGTNDSWEVAAEVYADYWVAEKAVPFDNFNTWPEVGDEWSANFTRHIGTNTDAGDIEWLSWSPLVQATFLDAASFCILEFIK